MIELLRRAAAIHPDRDAVITSAQQSVTYSHLVAAAEQLAAGLQDRGITRFGIASTDAVHVMSLLAAASLSGAQACVLPPVPMSDWLVVAHRLELPVVVSDDVSTKAESMDGVDVLAIDTLAGDRVWTEPIPQDRPHLVLTTGTTGTPKGIRYDWSHLVARVRRVEPDASAAGQRWLLAYGLHQFGGLQMLVSVAALGATLIAPVPRRPREGLAAMRAFGVTHASATPTYWRFVLAEIRADGGPVPAIEQVTMGGEASSPDLLQAIRTTFPNSHVTQVYAASEFGAINVSDGLCGLPTSLLDLGDDADVRLKIVDGELWVQSRVGMLGVQGQPPVDDGWRPTGDLVDVVDDRIRFCGRTSEVINVGGVKVPPLPVEERVTAVNGVQAARVYGRRNPVTGMVVAVEVIVAPGHEDRAVIDAVRAACGDLPPASQPRSIRAVAQLQTIGDKLLRRDPNA